MADILQNSVFDSEELEREREVILQEIGQAHDTPDDIIHDHFQEISYQNQSLGRPILGPSSIIKRMDRETLMQFMRHHYDPNQIVLVASGNVTHEHVVEWASDTLSLPPCDHTAPILPANFVGGDFRQSRDLEQLHLLLGMQGPSAIDARHYDGVLLLLFLEVAWPHVFSKKSGKNGDSSIPSIPI